MLVAPGFGKTYIAECVADYLFGTSPASRFIVDCGSTTDEYVNTLIGAPTGYSGHKKDGKLVSALNMTDGHVVIIFDEWEKVAVDSDGLFPQMALSLFEEGRVQPNNDAPTVYAYNSVIFLTSNIHADEIAEAAVRYEGEELDKVVKKILEQTYAKEFIGRLDGVVPLRPLNNRERAAVFEAEAEKLANKYGITIDDSIGGIAEDIFVKAVRATHASSYGMRDLRRWVEDSLGPCFVDAKDQGVTAIRLKMVGDEFIAKPLERELVS